MRDGFKVYAFPRNKDFAFVQILENLKVMNAVPENIKFQVEENSKIS